MATRLFIKQYQKYVGDTDGCIIYFNYLLIVAETLEQHERIMNKIIKRPKKYNIKFNIIKLQYLKNEVRFMGLIFIKQGICSDAERKKVIKNLKYPNCKKKLQ